MSLLVAMPASGCSILSSGKKCGGEACPDAYTCTLVGLADCKCVKNGVDTLFPPPLSFLELSTEEAASLVESGDRSGGVVAVRIFFRIQGLGSFRANTFDTAKGQTNAWVKPGLPLNMTAAPAPGQKLERWLLNGNFASTSPSLRARATRGLTITAVFESSTADASVGASGADE